MTSAEPNEPVELQRLREAHARQRNWQRWGPYLAERQWGTVREDYSPNGDVWAHFTHDQSRSRAYRWGEDGILGITDRECRLCFALAMWNGRDPILKERLFGLTGPEGNHGEDVKELYHYLDATPTSTYLKGLYRYPQAKFPYAELVAENGRRGLRDREYEITDAGAFDAGWFDVYAEYAKEQPNDILMRITVINRGDEPAALDLLPTLWFRNTWIWGCRHEGCTLKPSMRITDEATVACEQETLGQWTWRTDAADDGTRPRLVTTENETNTQRLYGHPNYTSHVKDAFHRWLIDGEADAVHPNGRGTKAAAHYRLRLGPGERRTVRLRLYDNDEAPGEPFGDAFGQTFRQRIEEADAYYKRVLPDCGDADRNRISREACAGLLWTKQFYHYIVKDWLDGDPAMPDPPPERKHVRNTDWPHLFNRDVLSMPDKWEYPWFASWDLAFHMVPMARLDPVFAKKQLILLLREWYMHPSGQIPAYEFELSDVNPPVHAWACLKVYRMTGEPGRRDRAFLARAFQKLLLNFTWWVNRKDPRGRHLFAGGFLGLDNIGVFDRSKPLPGGGHLEQADGTAWMAFYCLNMLAMALELAEDEPAYEDLASKFFEHFVHIVDAMNELGGTGLWDERDGFYYDQLNTRGRPIRLRVRSLVGLIPLLAVHVLDQERIERLPGFRKRMNWFLNNRADLARHISYMESDRPGEAGNKYLLAVPNRDRLRSVLRYMLDEGEFLSPFGVRSLSAHHRAHPYTLQLDGERYSVAYVPGESDSGMFGGNSNWRGPVWWPVNFLLIEALREYHRFFGDGLTVECPAGSGAAVNLHDAAGTIGDRLCALFDRDERGARPCFGDDPFYGGPAGGDAPLLFHEYFHGDTGRGLGAGHQTGWTALIAELLAERGKR